ncbi:YcxB family protein [Microbispora sp. NPDC046933]|uniref:YcxB family protein n=1 Tax=Microbispora sp. NPDC046933 TaxID=3155618 RepID=UPI0033FFBDCD
MRVTSGDAGFGTFLLTCGLLCGPLATWRVTRTARLQAPQFCLPTAIRLTNEAYHAKTAQYTSIRLWASFLKIRETREFWLLYTHQRFAVIIPKRVFDAAQQREINDFLRGAVMQRSIPFGELGGTAPPQSRECAEEGR